MAELIVVTDELVSNLLAAYRAASQKQDKPEIRRLANLLDTVLRAPISSS